MKSFIKKIQKIDHFTVQYAVDQVADGSAQNKDQSVLHQGIFAGGPMKDKKDRANGNKRNHDEEHHLVIVFSSGEKPERHPRVTDMRDAEKTVYHSDRIMQGNMDRYHELRVLIEDDQRVGDQE